MNKVKQINSLRRSNNERDKLLSPSMNKVYTDMVVYIRGSNLSEENIELVRSDLLDILLEAQTDGRTVDEVFGDDVKEVCDEIIKSLPKKTRLESIIEKTKVFLFALAILTSISLVKKVIADLIKEGGLKRFTISTGELISFGLIIGFSYLIFYFITRDSLKKEEEKTKWQDIKEISLFFTAIIAIMLPTIIFKVVVFTISYGLAFIILALIYVLAFIVNKF